VPSDGKPAPPHYGTDSSKAEKEFGLGWIELEKCMTDTVDRLLELEKNYQSAEDSNLTKEQTCP